MSLGSKSKADGALVDRLDGVLDLVQSSLRTPHGNIGVILVAEHGLRSRGLADSSSPMDGLFSSYELE